MDTDTVMINGIVYVPQTAQSKGNRHVVVIDRGWIVAGDLEDRDGRIYLDRAVHVRHWSDIGFDGMIENPNSNKVVLRPMKHIFNIPADSEIFRIPVSETWGL